MKYKEFVKWCNQRACDGLWGMNTALCCIEEDWNKLEFMINNFSKLEEENNELKRLLKLAIESFDYIDKKFGCAGCNRGWKKCPYNTGEKDCCTEKWKYHDEAMKLIGEDND